MLQEALGIHLQQLLQAVGSAQPAEDSGDKCPYTDCLIYCLLEKIQERGPQEENDGS